MNSEFDTMPTNTDDEKREYNSKIIQKMLSITATPANQDRENKIRAMHDLYSRYISGVEDTDRLIKQTNAFESKYGVKIMEYNMENTFGPHSVSKPDGTTYRRWGGKNKKRKTNKKSRRNRRTKGKR